MMDDPLWPALPLDDWADTQATLHLWTQIVGKVRLAQTPWVNHSWHVPLYVTARGLTTLPIPHSARLFQIDIDLVDHRIVVETGEGDARTLTLRPRSVASLYHELMATLDALGLPVDLYAVPNEVEAPIPFADDETHASYDAEAAARFGRALRQAHRLLSAFRAPFVGKVSPVHFFWGSFDLAVTRFSGREAPPHPGGIPNLPDWVAREAYSHEVSSAGFWPGGGPHPFPLFYSYAYPAPDGFRAAAGLPDGAFYSDALGEFVLPYDVVRAAADPDATVRAFLDATYAAAADLAGWDRNLLERIGPPGALSLRDEGATG